MTSAFSESDEYDLSSSEAATPFIRTKETKISYKPDYRELLELRRVSFSITADSRKCMSPTTSNSPDKILEENEDEEIVAPSLLQKC